MKTGETIEAYQKWDEYSLYSSHFWGYKILKSRSLARSPRLGYHFMILDFEKKHVGLSRILLYPGSHRWVLWMPKG